MKETVDSLSSRLNTHEQYGTASYATFLWRCLAVHPGMNILDLGCGEGKFDRLIVDSLDKDCNIVATDKDKTLLDKAVRDSAGYPITYMEVDFDQVLPLGDHCMHLVFSSFAFYYAADVKFTLSEIKRVLVPGGKLVVFGPLSTNKREFKEVILQATGIEMPSNKFSPDITDYLIEACHRAEIKVFRNLLTFPDLTTFMDYTRATFDPKRGVFDFEPDYQKVAEIVADKFPFTVTKVVGAVIAQV